MTDTNTTAILIPTDMLRAALICASASETRYYLKGIFVDPKGFLVSTDGHRAFIGKIDLFGADIGEGWIMPRDAIKRALTGHKANVIEISPTRCGDIACQPVDGSYPDWRRVIPAPTRDDNLSGVTAQFDPAYVADMGKIGEILAGKRKGVVLPAQILHNGDSAAGVTFSGRDDCFGVLMPIRSQFASPADAAIQWANLTALTA